MPLPIAAAVAAKAAAAKAVAAGATKAVVAKGAASIGAKAAAKGAAKGAAKKGFFSKFKFMEGKPGPAPDNPPPHSGEFIQIGQDVGFYGHQKVPKGINIPGKGCGDGKRGPSDSFYKNVRRGGSIV